MNYLNIIKRYLFWFFVLIVFTISAQTKDSVLHSDCKVAKQIYLDYKLSKIKGNPTKNFGNLSEINFQPYPYAFKQEHHTAWYQLIIKSSGWLTMDIIPESPKDDYDFMLFKADSINACELIQKAKIKPIRAIISRNDIKLKGQTGLDSISAKRFDDEGLGSSYCKQIKVNTGDIYYLIVDNVYGSKRGHDIQFKIKQKKQYKIKIRDQDGNTIDQVNFSLKDEKSKFIKKITADSNGYFTFEPKQFGNTYVHIDKEGYFTKVFNTNQTTYELDEDYQIELKKLTSGETFTVNNILFEGNATIVLKESYPIMQGLLDMLITNKTLKIEIHGHINESPENAAQQNFKLSELRAKKIYDYLISKGIEAKRLNWKGFGGTQPVYKEYVNETYCKYNRRVEIKIIDF